MERDCIWKEPHCSDKRQASGRLTCWFCKFYQFCFYFFLYCSTLIDFQRLCIKSERCCLFWSYLLEPFNWRMQGVENRNGTPSHFIWKSKDREDIARIEEKWNFIITFLIFFPKGSVWKRKVCDKKSSKKSSTNSSGSNGTNATSKPEKDWERNTWYNSRQQEVLISRLSILINDIWYQSHQYCISR